MASNRKLYAVPASDFALDDTDRRLLAELQTDARLTRAEIGRRVGLSAPAVAERIQRLERGGVIRGYHAELDPRAVGYSLSAIIRMRPDPGQIQNAAELARRTPEIVECHRVTGEDCFVIKAHVRDVEHLEQLIDRFVVLGRTTSSIMQSSPVPVRGLEVDARPS